MEVWNKQVREAGQQTALRVPVELARIAPFTLAGLAIDPSRKSVRSADGQEELLEPRVMQVLCALVRADGAILTRDDLTASCWGGTHVGDDAIQRVIARLRRVATGIGADRFAIETLPRIGYRLMVPAAEPAAAAPGVAPRATPVRKPRRFVIAACAALALLTGGGLWWWTQPGARRTMTLRIDPLQSAKGVAPSSGDPFDAQLRASLNNADRIVIRPDKADYRLTGTLTQDTPDTLRYSFNLQAADGTMPWSASFPGAATARAQTRMAQKINLILRCGLGGLAIYPRMLSVEARSLYFEACQPGAYNRQIDIGRRLTAVAPDFAPGWSHLAIAYESGSYMATPGEQAGFRAQAIATARHAIALNPNMGGALSDIVLSAAAQRIVDRARETAAASGGGL